MKNGRRLTIALVLLAIVFPIVLYVVAYFAIARPGMGMSSLGRMSWSPSYSEDFAISSRLRILFEPLHRLDRTWLRPELWVQDSHKRIGIPLHDLPKSSPTSSSEAD